MPVNNRSDIEWAPRVGLLKIRRLYVREAQGICDDELIDEVGIGLYLRCRSILEFTRAVELGQVMCKRCANQGVETVLQRVTMKPAEMLKCPVCGWQIQWRVYLKETERLPGNLHAGHARDAFQRFARDYPRCEDAREKLVAIDQLIHEFHWIAASEDKEPDGFKPAGVNLLQGTTAQVLALLDELTYGDQAPPQVAEVRDWWLEQRKRGPGRAQPREE